MRRANDTVCNIEDVACDVTRAKRCARRSLVVVRCRSDATRHMQIFPCQQAPRSRRDRRVSYEDDPTKKLTKRGGRRSGRRSVVVPLAHSLPRGSPVCSSSAILITTSFSHWIRWRVKIEGAALLVSSGPYPKVTRPRCTFLAALRHLDLAAAPRRRPITYRRRLMRGK